MPTAQTPTPTPVNALMFAMILGTLLSHEKSHFCVILRLSLAG